MQRFPIAGPSITEKEIAYVCDAVTHAWYDRANEFNVRFEKSFAEYVGRQFAVSLPSCTSAIHLSLLALGVGPGDEVIVPDLTWIASAAPVTYVGATPVFADVDRDTWCLSASSLRECISQRTKAVIAVDLYGHPVDMNAILPICAENDIAVIEDAAEAIGSEYHSKRAGSFGDCSTFSFHGSKTLTTGEGGMLVTDRPDIVERVLFLRDHGRPAGDQMFYNTEVGYKYKMSSLQAALGLAQLERIEELVVKKRDIFKWYSDRLSGIAGLKLNCETPGVRNSFWMVTIVLDSGGELEKEELIERLSRDEISCRPVFYPLSYLPAYEGLESAGVARARNKVSYEIGFHGVNLPSALSLGEADVDYICAALRRILQ